MLRVEVRAVAACRPTARTDPADACATPIQTERAARTAPLGWDFFTGRRRAAVVDFFAGCRARPVAELRDDAPRRALA